MPTDSLMPKKKSGGSGYVVAAIVMFAIMGGLILWKASQGPAKPDSPPVVEAPSTQTAAPLIDAPPPPPPEVKDAGEEPEVPRKEPAKRTGPGPGPNGCAAKVCEGTAGADLKGAMASKAGQARSCYQNALRNDSTLAGRMTVGIRVGLNGLACSAGVTSDGMGSPQVATCVTRLFQAGKYPPPKGGCVDMSVPMNFTPKK